MNFNELCNLAYKNINTPPPDSLSATEVIAYFSLTKLAWHAQNKIWNKEQCEKAKNKIFQIYKYNIFHDKIYQAYIEKLKELEPYVTDFKKTKNIKSAEKAIDIFYGLLGAKK